MLKSFFYKLNISLVAIFIATGTPFLNADDSKLASGTLTLNNLVEEVLKNNPELKFYEAEIQAAKGLRSTAGRWQNPEASGSLGQKKAWDEDEELTGKGKTGEISLMQTFEWPGRITLRRAIADRDIELAELSLKQFRASLESEARKKAYELYAAKEIVSSTKEVADHFRGLREVLLEREPAGLTPLLETRIIEAMDLNIQRKAGDAEAVANRALYELNIMRGASIDTPLILPVIKLSFQSLEDADSLIALARANDYGVRKKAIELNQRNLEVSLAENERLPNIALGPSFSQERAGERERVMAVAVSLPLPIWNQNHGNIETAKAKRIQAETQLDLAKRDAEKRLFEAVHIYRTKLKEMSAWRQDSIQHFKEAAELADRHYRLGAVPVSVYVDLQTQYLEAMESLHHSKKEALDAATQLEIITGKKLSLVTEEKQ